MFGVNAMTMKEARVNAPPASSYIKNKLKIRSLADTDESIMTKKWFVHAP